MADRWDPAQYGKFAAERAQPFWDLVGLIERDRPIRRAVDLGCGSGELTAAAAELLQIDAMEGIDSSDKMLAAAAPHTTSTLRFRRGDLGEWTSSGDHDLVLANASLQWVPDHVGVLTRWWAGLGPGGQLAVQVPANADHPSHRVAAEVAGREPYLSAMSFGPGMKSAPPPDVVARNVLLPEQYAILLDHLGAARQHVRLQVYGHVLSSSTDVVEWVKGTSLTRFVDVLPDELHDPFIDEYRRRLLEVIGDTSPYFYPFKRIMFWGIK